MTPVSDTPRTALVLPVPEAAGLVADAHIALLDPFLPSHLIDDGVLAELREFFAELVPFAYVLGERAEFPNGSAYLPPQPVGVFRRVIHQLRRSFPELVGPASTLDTFVPHLALPAGSTVTGPIEAHGRETQLRLDGPGGVRVIATFRFGTSAA